MAPSLSNKRATDSADSKPKTKYFLRKLIELLTNINCFYTIYILWVILKKCSSPQYQKRAIQLSFYLSSSALFFTGMSVMSLKLK